LLVGAVTRADAPSAFSQPDARAFRDVFVWTDTTNVYVLRDGDAALLIDLGDGSVLDRLNDIGVRTVEWVLFTHHHREQCQGAPLLKGTTTKVGAPEGEQALFERPTNFRRMNVRLEDPFTIHGVSYIRPPIQPIVLDKALKPGERFAWRKYEITCLATPGNSPAAMMYVVELNGHRLAFTGDVMLNGATMHTWYDTEWDYGFAAGIRSLRKTVATLIDSKHDVMLPSHGPAIRDPAAQLKQYAEKLERLEKLYVRGYGVEAASYQSLERYRRRHSSCGAGCHFRWPSIRPAIRLPDWGEEGVNNRTK
jgi:glyoxylase-like metal-dependent hydrolase (beta-lactamase superfamily II)